MWERWEKRGPTGVRLEKERHEDGDRDEGFGKEARDRVSHASLSERPVSCGGREDVLGTQGEHTTLSNSEQELSLSRRSV